ncbi:MAG: YceI family protein [Halioglobus sp.]
MRHSSFIINITAALLLSGLCANAFAGWQLDSEASSVQFITIKNTNLAESHSFGEVSGSIDDAGVVTVSLGLDSVETLVPIRNERIREFLFETANFATAEISAAVQSAHINAVVAGDVVKKVIPVTLSLHGESKTIDVSVILIGTENGTLLATTAQPILVNAADFALTDGVEKLRELAGLESISWAVPVSFQLEFVAAP